MIRLGLAEALILAWGKQVPDREGNMVEDKGYMALASYGLDGESVDGENVDEENVDDGDGDDRETLHHIYKVYVVVAFV